MNDNILIIGFWSSIVIIAIVFIIFNLLGIVVAFEVYILQSLDPDNMQWYQWIALASFSDIALIGAYLQKDGN